MEMTITPLKCSIIKTLGIYMYLQPIDTVGHYEYTKIRQHLRYFDIYANNAVPNL